VEACRSEESPFFSARVREFRPKALRVRPCVRANAVVRIPRAPGRQATVQDSGRVRVLRLRRLRDSVQPDVQRGQDSAMFPEV